jgi:hypothetical protein
MSAKRAMTTEEDLRKRLNDFQEFLMQPGSPEKRPSAWIADQILMMLRMTEPRPIDQNAKKKEE